MDHILQEYINIIKFFGYFIPKNIEVVLHDSTTPDNSVIAIVNGHISGRKLGSSLNASGVSYIRNKVYQDVDELLDCKGIAKDGSELICHTKFIKSKDGELLGMLCINIDNSSINEHLNELLKVFGLNKTAYQKNDIEQHKKSTFSENVEETVNIAFKEAIDELNLPSDRLSQQEKMDIMRKLEEKGIFLFKGSISEVAKMLTISEATAYRYLSKIERKGNNG